MKIRTGTIADLDDLQKLVKESIRHVCIQDYSHQQIEAWVTTATNQSRREKLFEEQVVIIAFSATQITGFAAVKDSYIDMLYVHKDFQKKGVARRIYEEIEKNAIKNGFTELISNVSITAKRFFKKQDLEL